MSPKPKTKSKGRKEPQPSVFDKFLDKKDKFGQLYARVPIERFERFHKILEKEDLSVYKAVDISIKMFIDFYESKSK